MEIVRDLGNLPQMTMPFSLVNLGPAYWLMGNIKESLPVLLKQFSDREASDGLNDCEPFI